MSTRVMQTSTKGEGQQTPSPAGHGGGGNAEVSFRAGHRADLRYERFPLTDIQQAYWVGRSGEFELGQVSAHGYMEVDASEVEHARLEAAFNKVIARHDMLRAVVDADGLQRVLPDVPAYAIRMYDLGESSHIDASHKLCAVRAEMSHQVLDATRWPLFDIRASHRPDGTWRIHISIDVLIFDAHSFDIISRDWEHYYRERAALPELEFTYADYVRSLGGLNTGPEADRSAAYWRARVDDFPAAPELPLLVGAGELNAAAFVRRTGRLPAAQWSRIKALGAGHQLTPSVIVMAAYAAVLTRWSAIARFALNLTLFNRVPVHPEIDDVVGDFTAVLPLAVEPREQRGFAEFARGLQGQIWSDLEHRQFSGIQFVRELAERRRGGSAVLPVVFTSTLRSSTTEPVPGAMAWLGAPGFTITQTPQVWLDCQVAEEDGGLVYDWDAVDGIFPEGMLDDMFGAFSRLIASLEDGTQGFGNSPVDLLPEWQAQVRAAANDTSGAVATDLLHERVLEQCAHTPERIAVVGAHEAVSYGELRLEANRLAHALWARGVESGERIGILVPKGAGQVIAALGILEASAVYVPLDPEWPRERLGRLSEICGISTCVVATANADPGLNGVACIALDELATRRHELSPLPSLADPEDLAYIIFTSGTTGRPKGVAIDHRGALNTVLDINERYQVGPEDRVLALSALTFDLSVYDIFGLLAIGGAVVMPSPEGVRDPAHWHHLMVEHRVTVWNTVPALMDIYSGYLGQVAEERDETLRVVMMSGDWIPTSLPPLLDDVLPNAEIHSLGGATEASVWSIAYPILKMEPEWKRIPYGKPLRNQRFHVLNECYEPCPVFVQGQLFIAGIGLAQGYLNDPEQTASSFVLHPATGERLYRTGDIGRYLPDGNIDFLGREDSQAKVNGFRVELEEIECAANRVPGVRATVVALFGAQQGAKRLVGYYVPAEEGESAQRNLRYRLSEPGIREFDAAAVSVNLPRPTSRLDVSRVSTRRFAPEPISADALARLLGPLQRGEQPGMPKYRYGSAGGLYPVQTYVAVRGGRVEGIASGIYYYHPAQHKLFMVAAGVELDRRYVADGNQVMWDESAFQILFVGLTDVLKPRYGDSSRYLLTIEAGLMTQLVEDETRNSSLGVCQVGGFDFERVRSALGILQSNLYLHTIVGGTPRAEPDSSSSNGADAEERDLGLAIKEHLRGELPAYMVPATWVPIERIPLSANGKVDRNALPNPEISPTPTAVTVPAELDALSREIAEVWARTLGLPEVGLGDRFFELGGTSVHMIKIHAALEGRLPKKLSLVDMFFTYPTIAELVVELYESDQRPTRTSQTDRNKRLAQQRDRRKRRHTSGMEE